MSPLVGGAHHRPVGRDLVGQLLVEAFHVLLDARQKCRVGGLCVPQQEATAAGREGVDLTQDADARQPIFFDLERLLAQLVRTDQPKHPEADREDGQDREGDHQLGADGDSL
jgi:hypothetical protein